MRLILTQPVERSEDIDLNFEMILHEAERVGYQSEVDDILVLPELIGATSTANHYERWVCTTAEALGCMVVGGSHHEQRGNRVVNCGVVANPDGDIVAHYDKQRPYGIEVAQGIASGDTLGQFRLNERNVVVLICFDLWFSDLFQQMEIWSDVVVIPSFSVSQRTFPESAQNLWQHMTVSRAHEFATYIGVSDWAYPCEYNGLKSSGVAGLANPRPEGIRHFDPVGDEVFKSHHLNFERLDRLHENRIARGFVR